MNRSARHALFSPGLKAAAHETICPPHTSVRQRLYLHGYRYRQASYAHLPYGGAGAEYRALRAEMKEES